MLLSLLKILFFFAVVLAVALGAIYLSETAQTLTIQYGGTEIALSPVKAVIALLILMVLAWIIFKILGLMVAALRFVAGDETAINRHFARSRERKGYDALGEGMLAVASGEGKLAQEKAAKAGRYLDRPHITNLLTAQAAEVAGDSSRAESAYRTLLEDNRTRFVGIRGLMRQSLEHGDTATALKLAQKAYALKPRHKDMQDTLLDLQTREKAWKGARTTLKDQRRQGDLPKDVHLRRDAVLALQEASEVLAEGNSISAREAAISAAKASPDLIPAAVLAARSYIAQKDMRNAARILEKTWTVNPHPDIAATYAEIAPNETPAARIRRFDRLIGRNSDHIESRLLKTELLLSAEDFPGARRALGDLAEKHPTVRTLSMMAAIERGEGADDNVVRGWMARALTAPRGPQWVCDKCHNIMAEWSPTCDSCGGFDTLTWRQPEDKQSTAGMGHGAEMLPLLLGGPDLSAAGLPKEQDVAVGKAPVDAPDVPLAGRASSQALTARQPSDPKPHLEIAMVAPGMVPRESDYVEIEPSRTITTPEPEPVRPDVEPADEADWTETPPKDRA